MYKKTKPRSVMELLNKNPSEREVAAILGCSRNTVSEIKELCRQQGMTWDDIQDMTDDGLYDILYPKKFKRTTNYVPVNYAYVHSELKKTGVTMKLLREEYRDKCVSEGREYCAYPTFTVNYYKYTGEKNYTSHIQHKPGVEAEVDWSGPTMSYVDVDTGEIITAYLFVATLPYSQYGYVEAATDMKEKAWLECHVHMFEFFEGTPVKIVCGNLKTGVVSHPKKGGIILNDAYLALGEYYMTAIMPTGVKKPKQKASAEGSVGKIATAVIAKLRNEIFTSLESLNSAIRKAVKEYNDRPFQKRDGSRSTVFNTQEKAYLRALPSVPYEVCEWSYGHKAGKNSHISFNKGQYSVPSRYIGCKVDVWMEEPPARRNFETVLKLLGEAEVAEQNKPSKLDMRMKLLEETGKLGAAHPAVKQYNKCMWGRGIPSAPLSYPPIPGWLSWKTGRCCAFCQGMT